MRIGAYFFVHRFFNEVSNAVLGPLPLISTSEVETIHPLWALYAQRADRAETRPTGSIMPWQSLPPAAN
jgi:hypothetical protein